MADILDHDLLIVGAGIHGAAVAAAAAAAGLRTLVVEQGQAAAAGTSSRSSKLIHGGLRYLEHGDWRLVRESLRERAWLLEHRPQLVHSLDLHLAVYPGSRRPAWQLRVGLALYALLGGFGRATRFGSVPKRAWPALDGLRQDGLRAVLRYRDGQTDDAALTRAVLAQAEADGAEVRFGTRLLTAEQQPDAVTAQLARATGTATVRVAALVNAAGPWAPALCEHIAGSAPPPPCELVQGSHLVLRGALQRGGYYLEAPQDGRPVFCLPWQHDGEPATLLGTTETAYAGDPAAVAPQPQEIDYLLAVFGHYFPQRAHDRSAILDSFAGLRVLPVAEGAFASRSRETLLHTGPGACPRVLSILGGKLTTHRVTAARVLNILRPALAT